MTDEPTNDEENKELAPLKIAEMMKKDLAMLETYENRREITDYLKDQFVAQRLEASSKQETLRESVLNALIKRIDSGQIPVPQLLKILEVTNKGGEVDLASVTGGGKSGGVNLQINNTPQANNVNSEGSTIESTKESKGSDLEDLGLMLEAMKTISDEVSTDDAKNIIDVKPTND